jgi:hemerythrin-like domain-containing protein
MIDDIVFFDGATRPHAPKLEGVTEAQREGGRHLRMIHDHLRENMRVLRGLIDRAAAGQVTAKQVAEKTADIAFVANFRRFGNLCGQHCQFVHGHHSLEDAMVFPALARQSDGLRKVAERLQAEHGVIHELLLRLIDALELLAGHPTSENFASARIVYEAMERVLASHLGYEEEEIGDALGYYNLI